ncbi:hypothetical protein TREMEDRAFT_64774 [Tremella mesenterica DSM 1558]|uniref:uncharacterized protein n=1 Tax=Tremella mesenterica (strain ATCC 24925 / CBS 8224 / DSM 1558 / NBRC 9311 / NRRL Y-6157 / RJB 2259-6 / UBC 559-6) TaxID=578456 RepID=UPI0003F48D0A|nr:uncharacterized protein TREMEDRAFT_64774 [Tremella mesenterica DSM 1558]EIW66920.1 hypothetical protein TREMEDRAFT_64774 [Tremella mesenterica DSM 1558]
MNSNQWTNGDPFYEYCPPWKSTTDLHQETVFGPAWHRQASANDASESFVAKMTAPAAQRQRIFTHEGPQYIMNEREWGPGQSLDTPGRWIAEMREFPLNGVDTRLLQCPMLDKDHLYARYVTLTEEGYKSQINIYPRNSPQTSRYQHSYLAPYTDVTPATGLRAAGQDEEGESSVQIKQETEEEILSNHPVHALSGECDDPFLYTDPPEKDASRVYHETKEAEDWKLDKEITDNTVFFKKIAKGVFRERVFTTKDASTLSLVENIQGPALGKSNEFISLWVKTLVTEWNEAEEMVGSTLQRPWDKHTVYSRRVQLDPQSTHVSWYDGANTMGTVVGRYISVEPAGGGETIRPGDVKSEGADY